VINSRLLQQSRLVCQLSLFNYLQVVLLPVVIGYTALIPPSVGYGGQSLLSAIYPDNLKPGLFCQLLLFGIKGKK
jgi:hypothetical protein